MTAPRPRTPEDCRATAYTLARTAERLTREAISVAGNDKNRDREDRALVDNLYRTIAIKLANRLLYDLHATDAERGVGHYWQELAP